MKSFSNKQITSLFRISFRSLLVYMFFMINTGFVFAARVTIDNIRFSATDGAERSVFLPGEQGLAHVDYTLSAKLNKKVFVRGKIKGSKAPGGKWEQSLKKQKEVKQPGNNTDTLSFTVDPDAVVGSEATVNITVNIKTPSVRRGDGARRSIRLDREQTTFSIVDKIPTSTSTPTSTPTATPTSTPTPEPQATPTQTPAGDPEPPVLETIGAKSIDVGDTLEFSVVATDPNNDPLTFSVSPVPLPDNASFNAGSGAFKFSPAVNQTGDFQLTFTVSDGALTDSETITITVIGAAPDGVTSLKGRLLDANDAAADITTPIVGATITNAETGLAATTDGNGNFTLAGLAEGLNHFDFDGGTANGPNGSTYGVFRGMQDIIANVANVIARPVFIMRLEIEGEAQVDPNTETIVENERIGVMIDIPPQTAMADDGSLFTGMISISEVPAEFTPASLPEALEPGMVVTIQPAGLTFDQPVSITFPNVDEMAPGSQVNIWSLNHETGEFFVSGKGEVSADGSEINTIEGGITAASWHLPIGLLAELGDPNNPNCQCKKKDCDKKTGSFTSVASGDLTIDHTLVSYKSLNRSRALRLVYNSDRAHPMPIISSNVTNVKEADVPLSISTKISVAGVDQGVEVFTDTKGLNQDADDTIIQSVQFDASELETGRYPYRIMHRSRFNRSAVSSGSGDFVIVNNQSRSPFGAGWTLDGVQNILAGDDGNVLLTEGNGSALVFKPASVGSGDFSSPTSFFVNEGRIDGVAAGDFNNDLKPDLVVLDDLFGSGVSILLNDGNGAFEKEATIELSSSTQQVTVNDFNGDNNLDIAVTTRANISVLLGDGAGNVAEPVAFDAGKEPEAVTTGDFNNDGNIDMAVANESDDTVSIFIGNGAGSFAEPGSVTVGRLPQALTSADFNGDGAVDLAVVNHNGSSVTILLGDGSGAFNANGAEDNSVGDSPSDIAPADFNGDGIVDLAVTNDFSNHVSLLIGDGAGIFTVRDVPAGGAQRSVTVADFNGDNNLDMALTIRSNINVVGVLLGDGKGQFSEPVNFRAGSEPDEIEAGDFDDDKIIDLAMTDFSSETVIILKGDGKGGFANTPKFFGSGQNGFTVRGDDLNNDGIKDFTVLTRSGINVVMGAGDFTYPSSNNFSIGGADPRSFTLNDFNNDDIPDLAVASLSSDLVGILIGDGTGSFSDPVKVEVGNGPTPIVSSDFNNDGNIDIAVVNTIDSNADDPTVSILMGDGNAGFSESRFDVGERPTSISLVDFNNDGIGDLAIPDDRADIVSIYFGDGKGKFGNSVDFALGENANPKFVKAGDVDKDGSIDLVVLNAHSGSSSLLNNIEVLFGDGANGIISSINFSNGKGPISLALDDLDGDGALDIATGNQDSDDVTIYLGNGSGTFVEKSTYGIGGMLSLETASIEMITGDFNEDGIQDIVTTDQGAPVGINVLLGLPSNKTGFQSPPGDFSTLVKNEDGTFTRIMKNGAKINFNAKGFQTSVVDRNGNTTTYQYDAGGNLSSITDSVGLVTTLTYSGGKLAGIKDPAGRTTGFSVDGGGNLISITDPDAGVRQFEYDNRSLMTKQTSKRGFVTTYVFDSFGKMTLSTLPDGSTNQIRAGNSAGLVDPLTGEGAKDNPAPVVRPEDAASVFVDSNGNQTSFETNRFGASNMNTDALGGTTLIIRDENSNPTQIEAPNGAISQMTYDDLGNLVALKEAVGSNLQRQTSFGYDPALNLITKFTDAAGNITSYEYDANGNIIKIIDALAGERSFTYDGRGLLLSFTDTAGNTTNLEYDQNGNLKKATGPLGNVNSFTYDAVGNIVASAAGVGTAGEISSSFTYDALNRLLTSTNGGGAVTKMRYDKEGNLVNVENATGETTVVSYDELGRIVSIDDPVDGINKFSYDAGGNVIKSEDAFGKAFSNEYNEINQLVKSINAMGGVELFSYDDQGNLISYTDVKGQTSTFGYDILNRQTKKTDPLGLSATFAYDSRDNLAAKTDRKGQVITNSFNALSQLTGVKTPDNTMSFTYDPNGNMTALADNDSSLSFTYDQKNRLVTAATVDVGVQPAVTLTNTYDSFSNRTQLSDSAGGVTRFAFDPVGRLTQLVTPAGGSVDLGYDSVGGITQIAFPNGVNSAIKYDALGRLSGITHTAGGSNVISDLAYSHNDVGNILSISEAGSAKEFEYDDLQRLIKGDASGQPELYEYDAIGNRVSSAHKYDGANRLLEDSDFTYTYDANGNLLTKTSRNGGGITTYKWDAQNQLIQIDLPSGAKATYLYDGLGRRIEKSVDGNITRYIYDGFDILLEYDGTNTLVARYSHGNKLDQPLSMERGGQSYFYHADNLGSIRKVTGSTGAVVNSADYASYGSLENNVEGVQNPFFYTGRELDIESGLYYFRARYYDPVAGRFISEDPIGFIGGPNIYEYVNGNPVNMTDPLGLVTPFTPPVILALTSAMAEGGVAGAEAAAIWTAMTAEAGAAAAGTEIGATMATLEAFEFGVAAETGAGVAGGTGATGGGFLAVPTAAAAATAAAVGVAIAAVIISPWAYDAYQSSEGAALSLQQARLSSLRLALDRILRNNECLTDDERAKLQKAQDMINDAIVNGGGEMSDDRKTEVGGLINSAVSRFR